MRNYSIYIFLLFVLSVVVIFFVLLPKYKDLNSLKQELYSKKQELQSQEEYFQKVLENLDVLKNNENYLAKMETALPEEPKLAELLNYFQKVASQSELLLEEISPTIIGARMGEKIGVANVGLVLEGSYPGFKKFISTIEKSERLIEVKAVDFKYPKKTGPFEFIVETGVHYYAKEEALEPAK